MKTFEFLPHTADLKVKAYGKTLEEVFVNFGKAMSSYLTEGAEIKKHKKIKINLHSEDNYSLLYDFLEELLFLLEAKSILFSDADIKIKENSITGFIFGDDVKNYKTYGNIKAVTYSEISIKKTKQGITAQVVFDL